MQNAAPGRKANSRQYPNCPGTPLKASSRPRQRKVRPTTLFWSPVVHSKRYRDHWGVATSKGATKPKINGLAVDVLESNSLVQIEAAESNQEAA